MRATAPLERVSRLRSRGGLFRELLNCEDNPRGANDLVCGDGVLLTVFADAHSSPASPCPFNISVSSSSRTRKKVNRLTFKILRYRAVLKYDRFHLGKYGA